MKRQKIALLHLDLDRFRQGLNERELAILDQRILSDSPLTLQALGDRFGTTREAVRQAEARLMTKLSAFLKEPSTLV